MAIVGGTTVIDASHLPVSSYRNTEVDKVKIQELIAKRVEARLIINELEG